MALNIVRALNGLISDLEVVRNAADDELEEKRKEIADLEDKVDALTAELANVRAELAEAKAELALA